MFGLRRRLALALAGAALIAVGAWWFYRGEQRSIRALAGRLLSCPPEEVTVLASDTSDTAELYRVRACGRDATLMCNAPDFACSVETAELRAR